MSTELLALTKIYQGSKYLGTSIRIDDETDGTQVDLTGADIVMQMTRNGEIYASYNTTDNSLQIVDGEIVIPPHVPTLEAGVYEFDFSIIMPNGDPDTGIAQGTWEILKPKTIR